MIVTIGNKAMEAADLEQLLEGFDRLPAGARNSNRFDVPLEVARLILETLDEAVHVTGPARAAVHLAAKRLRTDVLRHAVELGSSGPTGRGAAIRRHPAHRGVKVT